VLLKKLGWWDELTDAEKKPRLKARTGRPIRRAADSRVHENHGCHPFGNAKARAVVWNFPDADPAAPRALYGNRPDLVAKYPRTMTKRHSGACLFCTRRYRKEHRRQGVRKIPAHHDSGRLVEYEGGGEETRSNPWLAELQQEMFIEVNPRLQPLPGACATVTAYG
jgi:formate dehydrogenase major subunit